MSLLLQPLSSSHFLSGLRASPRSPCSAVSWVFIWWGHSVACITSSNDGCFPSVLGIKPAPPCMPCTFLHPLLPVRYPPRLSPATPVPPCLMDLAQVGLPYLGQALALRFLLSQIPFLQNFPGLLPFHRLYLNATSQRHLLTTVGRAAPSLPSPSFSSLAAW